MNQQCGSGFRFLKNGWRLTCCAVDENKKYYMEEGK